MLRTLTGAALVVTLLSIGAAAQNASSVVAAASKAMGVDALNSITYSGTARNGAFGQSKAIGAPLAPVNTTLITMFARHQLRTLSRSSRARIASDGPDATADGPGRTRADAGGLQSEHHGYAGRHELEPGAEHLDHSLGIPEGRRGQQRHRPPAGRAAGRVVSPANLKSPSGQPYTVTGYIDKQNLVTKVETRVDHAVVGDLLVEFDYSNYRNMNGVQVPGRIVQKQAGMETFNADITAATPNPGNLAAAADRPSAACGPGRRPWRRCASATGGCGAGGEAR